jgi:hypothetical protein
MPTTLEIDSRTCPVFVRPDPAAGPQVCQVSGASKLHDAVLLSFSSVVSFGVSPPSRLVESDDGSLRVNFDRRLKRTTLANSWSDRASPSADPRLNTSTMVETPRSYNDFNVAIDKTGLPSGLHVLELV